jgi:hypothetical protein
VTTNDLEEYSKKIKLNIGSDIQISNGPFTEATFSKTNSQEKGNHGQRFPDYEVSFFTDTAQQKTLNQLTDGQSNLSSFYFVIPHAPEEISKVKFTFVKEPFDPLTGYFLKQFNVGHMKSILRYYFKRVPVNHSTILVLEGAGEMDAKKLDDDLQKISTLGDNPNITVNFVKFNSGKGGRKSHRSNSKKNKRTRRKSLKKQQHRRK